MTLHPEIIPTAGGGNTQRKEFPARLLGMVHFADLQPQLHKDRDSSLAAVVQSCLSCLVQSHYATGQLC